MTMYTLLPDETFCKTDLGLLLYSKRKVYDFDVYIVNTRLPTSFFGHVEYCALIKVNLVVYFNPPLPNN